MPQISIKLIPTNTNKNISGKLKIVYSSISGLQIRIVFLFSRMAISSSNPMFDYLLESSHRDDSNKWSNIGFDEEITQVESIEVNLMSLIWSSGIFTVAPETHLFGRGYVGRPRGSEVI